MHRFLLRRSARIGEGIIFVAGKSSRKIQHIFRVVAA